MFEHEFNIYDYFEKGWIDEFTFREYLRSYAHKKGNVSLKDLM